MQRRYAHTLLTQLLLQHWRFCVHPCPVLLLHSTVEGPVGQQMSPVPQQLPAQQVLPDPVAPHDAPVMGSQLPVRGLHC